jgi:TPR repeat protein
LSRREAEARYREASNKERQGDMQGAFKAYQEAAEGGHGPAQKKLGDLYGTGNAVVERDYETSLRWYTKAREQGIRVPKPFSYPGVRR